MQFTVRAMSAAFCLLASLSCFGQSYTGTNLGPIPDGTAAQLESYGASRDVYFDVGPQRTVTAVTVSFAAAHTYVSDLRVRLIAPNGNSHLLFARTGQTPQDVDGFSSDLNGTYTFTDSPTAANWWTGASSNPVPSGSYRTVESGGPDATNPPPVTSLNAQFNGTPANGRWILRFDDGFVGDSGAVTAATLNLTLTGSTIRVFNDNDSGSGSLRDAIQNAESGDLIRFETPFFSSARTINLLSPLPTITQAIAIQGRGAERLTIRRDDSAGEMRIFTIDAGTGAVSLSGMTISGGRLFTRGGGILSRSTLTLSDVHITGNFGDTGGGLALENAGGQIINSTISGNEGGTIAGAIFSSGGNDRPLRIIGSTISGNRGFRVGGILFVGSSDNIELDIVNSTIANNFNVDSEANGLLVRADGPGTAIALIRNSILANEAPNFGTGTSNGGTATIQSEGFNLSNDYNGVVNTLSSDRTGDPKLGPLAPQGGSTPTHLLLGGSAALGVGNRSGDVLDQRGIARGDGASADIGAVDMQVILVTNADDDGAGSLRAALTTANSNGPELDDIIFDASVFSSAQNIVLSSALPDINSAVTISGVGADLLRILRSFGEQFRIFNVNPGLEIASFSGMKVQNGTLTSGFGGGIFSQSPLTLAQMHINGNIAEFGGGIALAFAGGTIIDSTINDNFAYSRPAGVYLQDAGELPLRIINSTISGNQAVNSDGGIFNYAIGNGGGGVSRMEVINSTITGNSATTTGGLASVSLGGTEASVEIRNSIVAGNTGNNLGTFASTGIATISSRGFNLSDTDSSEFLDQPTDRNDANAGLATLADNGGPSPTHALRASSEALGAGSNSGSGFLFDQRGWPFIRPVAGDSSDIGAHEVRDEVFADRFE